MKTTGPISAALAAGLMAGVLSTPQAAVTEEDFHLESTEDLYQVCSVGSDASDYIPAIYECRGFIRGAVGYHDAVSDRKNLKRLICYPQSATLADGRLAFVDWAKANIDDQELMREAPVVGLVRALATKYPCSK